MKISERIRWFFRVLMFLNLVRSYSASDTTEGLLTKVGEDIRKNVNEGANFTGMEEMLEGVLDAALQITTLLPAASNEEAKRSENDSTREVKTFILDDNELHQRTENIYNSASRPINIEDIIKLQRIEDYYKQVLTGELKERPDPKEIEKHRSVLVKIFNQLMTKSTDRRLSSNIKELLSTLSNITDLGTLSTLSKVDSHLDTTGTTVKSTILSSSKKKEHSDKNTIILHGLSDTLLKNSRNLTEIQSDPVVVFKETVSLVSVSSEPDLNESTTDDVSKNNLINFQSGLNSMSVPTSENKFDSLKSYNSKLSSPPDVSGAEKLVSNSTISKRHGQVFQASDSYADASSYPLNLYQPHSQASLVLSSLPKTAYITYPQLHQGIVYQQPPNLQPLTQGSQHPRGTLNQGAFNRVSSHLGPSTDSIPESPLAITDSASLQGAATKNLFDILLQYNKAGSTSEYSNQLESALQALLTPQKTPDLLFVDNVNLQGLAVTPNPPNRSPLNVGLGTVNGISPEILANLLIRLQLPTNEEIRNISSQLTRFGSPMQDTRLGTLPQSIQDLLMAITTAITDIITALTTFCSMNPLVCVLLALALCAIFVHIYKKHGKKKKYHHKDSGYGGGGHDHRKTLLDYEEYRMLDSDTQLEVVSDVLGKIEVFENWLLSLRSKDKLNSNTKSR